MRAPAQLTIVIGLAIGASACSTGPPSSDPTTTNDPVASIAQDASETSDQSVTSPSTVLDAGPAAATTAIDELRRVATSDGERQYFLHAPASDGATPRPMVIVLHGHSGSSRQSRGAEISRSPMSVWLDIAAREQIVLVFPDGAVGSDDAQGWNDCRADARANPETDDVEFLAAVVDNTAALVAIDRSKVFTVGVSNGGFMSMRMASERPELIAGAAAIVASMASDSECDAPTEAVSILLMNGTADPLVDYEGGQVPFNRGGVMPTTEAVELWRELADAAPTGGPETLADLDSDDDSTVSRTTWSGTADIALYRIEGGGHNAPSIAEAYSAVWTDIVGPQNHDIEAAEEIWSFFVDASS